MITKYIDTKQNNLRGSSWEERIQTYRRNRNVLRNITLQYVFRYWHLENSCISVGFRIVKLNKNA